MKETHYIIKYNNFTYEYKDKKSREKDLLTTFKNHDVKLSEIEVNVAYLIEITLLNNKNQEFEKGFNDLKSCNNFLNKVKRGNSLRVTSIMSYNSDVLKEILK